MLVFVTYHPAALLREGRPKTGDAGPSRETLRRAVVEDLARVADPHLSVATPQSVSTVLLGSVVAVDTEYHPRWKRLDTIAAATRDGVVSWDSVLDLSYPYNLAKLGDVDVLVGHNIPEDLAQLCEAKLVPIRDGWLRGDGLVDTFLAAKMNNEERPSFKLEDLVAGHVSIEGWKKSTADKDYDDWTPAERKDRCGKDAWSTWLLAEHEWPGVEGNYPLWRFTMRTALTLHRMSLAGAFVSLSDYNRPETGVRAVEEGRYHRAEAELLRLAHAVGKTNFEATNKDHIRNVLYQRFGLPVLELTEKDKKPSVTKETIALLLEQATGDAKAFLEAWQTYAKVEKLWSTYVDPLAHLVYPVGDRGDGVSVGYLPFNFHTFGAKTSRRSSSNPNSQNWGKAMRGLVTSRWPGGSVLSVDYRKLEPIIIAWLAGDEKLLDFFTSGGGYIAIAKELFHTTIEEGTVAYRGIKSIVLGSHYNMLSDEMAWRLWKEPVRFSADYDEHWQTTDRVRGLYFEKFWKLTRYMERRKAELAATGAVRTPIGRLRRVGQGAGKREQNQAINAPVQGTASEVMASAFIDCEDAILAEAGVSLVEWYQVLLEHRRKFLTPGQEYGTLRVNYGIPVLFNEVHDELLADLPPGGDKWLQLIVETMKAVPTFRALAPYMKGLPLGVDAKRGPYWTK